MAFCMYMYVEFISFVEWFLLTQDGVFRGAFVRETDMYCSEIAIPTLTDLE